MSHESLKTVHGECLRLASELAQVLRDERKALILLSTDEIVQHVFRKEGLGVLLLEKRSRWKSLLSFAAGPDELATMKDEWRSAWSEITSLIEGNQRFVKHSLRNLGSFVDNIKRLFGEGSLYSAKGTKVDSGGAGKVLEASY